MQHFEGQAEKGRRPLLRTKGAADKGQLDGSIAQARLVESKALLFPVVRVGDSVADRLLHQQRRVLAADQGAAVAAVIQHDLGVSLMRHLGRHGRGR